MGNLIKALSPDLLKKCKKMQQPDFIEPTLATLTKNYFSSSDWLYEHKFDGVRCIAIKNKGNVSLLSRNRHSLNHEYPEIESMLEKSKADNFIIDGEVVALDQKGVSSFQLLQSRINLQALEAIKAKIKIAPVYYCVFDIMYLEGYDICNLPLFVRKKLLKKLPIFNKTILHTNHEKGDGITLFKQACKKGWEGLIVKKADSVYSGVRSKVWLKFKCSIGQELVIGGYTIPQGSRTDFGALLVGYYKDGKLQYAGRVGTGFSHDTLKMLGKKLRNLEIKTCPFVNYDQTHGYANWVKPLLVADFEFAEWTNKGKLRVGRYKGLRDDKPAQKVTREIPKV